MYGLRLVLTKLAAGDVRYKIDFVRTICSHRMQLCEQHVILIYPTCCPHFLPRPRDQGEMVKSRMFLTLSGNMRKKRCLRMLSSHITMSKARTILPTYVDAPSVYIGDEWTPSTIVKNVRNSTGVHRIDIEVERHIASQYKRPGQYIKVQGIERPVLLAIASPPDERNVLSFLVKDTPYHKYLLDLPTESSIDLSIPMGKGFQIQEGLNTHNDDQQVKHIVLMACGSGLAPIAAVIESGCLQLSPTNSQEIMDIKKSPDRTITLYIGARTRAHLPFAERYAEWEKKGVKVVPVLSRTEGRYVQEALQAELLEAPENTLALLCGMKGMTDAATELLLTAGVPKSRILLNF